VDTRTKILSPDSLDAVRSATRRMKVVIGYFDPLLAAHARRLAELREPDQALVVIVRELEGVPAAPAGPRGIGGGAQRRGLGDPCRGS
jgi:hypothetical protein